MVFSVRSQSTGCPITWVTIVRNFGFLSIMWNNYLGVGGEIVWQLCSNHWGIQFSSCNNAGHFTKNTSIGAIHMNFHVYQYQPKALPTAPLTWFEFDLPDFQEVITKLGSNTPLIQFKNEHQGQHCCHQVIGVQFLRFFHDLFSLMSVLTIANWYAGHIQHISCWVTMARISNWW